MRKLSKRCSIKLFIENKNTVTELDYYDGRPCEGFYGKKNDVMSDLRKHLLKYEGFTGETLADTMNAINKTSKVYKGLGEGICETTVHSFNPTTKLLYTFMVKYELERLSNLPSEYATNNEGENLREKRLIQRHGGGLFGRYKLALESVNTSKLLELLSPTIQTRFKEESAIKFLGNDKFRIEYPRYFEFKPNDDLCIKISLSSYDFNTVTVYIVYKNNNVYLLDKCPDKITKKKLDEVLKLAEQFDEICELVKKSYPEY